MIHQVLFLLQHTQLVFELKGETSGAIGFVFSTETNDAWTSSSIVNLVNVSGTFQVGEKLIASDSAETGKDNRKLIKCRRLTIS